MSEPFNERRQPRPMRILYMPMRSFLQRFILRGQFPSLVPRSEAGLALPPAAGLAPPPVQARERATWKCGVTQLDAQNEALLRAIRQFLGALKQAVGPEAMEEALTALELHLEGHLPMEEAYLEQVQFPDQVGHRAQHKAFQHMVQAFHRRMTEGDPSAGLELSQLLYAWMREHVLKEDAVWSEFARSRRRP